MGTTRHLLYDEVTLPDDIADFLAERLTREEFLCDQASATEKRIRDEEQAEEVAA